MIGEQFTSCIVNGNVTRQYRINFMRFSREDRWVKQLSSVLNVNMRQIMGPFIAKSATLLENKC